MKESGQKEARVTSYDRRESRVNKVVQQVKACASTFSLLTVSQSSKLLLPLIDCLGLGAPLDQLRSRDTT